MIEQIIPSEKFLSLNTSKNSFERIKAGLQTEQYREIIPYWIKRLTQFEDQDGIDFALKDLNKGYEKYKEHWEYKPYLPSYYFPKEFTHSFVYVKGTDLSKPENVLKLETKSIIIRTGNPEWGAEEGKLYFVIKHGNIIK